MIPPNSIVPMQLNKHSPQYRGLSGLFSYWTGVRRHDPQSGIAADFTGTGYDYAITEYGQSFYVADTTVQGRMRTQNLPRKFNPAAGSLLIWIRFRNKITVGATSQVAMRSSTGAQSFTDFTLNSFNSGDPLVFRIRNGSPDYTYVTLAPSGSDAFVAGDFSLFMGTYWWDGSTTYYTNWHRIRNGGDYATASTSGAINQMGSSGTQEWNAHPTTSTQSWEYDLYEARYYDRILSVQEMWDIWNPATRFDLYKQAVNPRYFSWTNLYQTKMRPVGGR